MLSEKQLEKFADLAVKIGINLQVGQDLNIRTQIECAPIARMIAVSAYKAGARRVMVDYLDEKLKRIDFDYQSIEALEDVPNWAIEKNNYLIDHNCANISIAAGDPSIYTGVSAEKLQKSAAAYSKANKYYRDGMMSNACRWLVISVPTKAWADKIFPKCDNSVDKLWDAIAMTMRLDQKDPVGAWEKHIETLTRRAEFMNSKNFDHVHLTNKHGTDLKVGLAEGHIWCAAQELAKDGIKFTANMPTEEIFTAPHKDRVDGVVVSALPLVNQGNIIEDFSITFKAGRVVDFKAKKGYDALSNIIETDDGSHYLGEVALIGKNSPIAKSGLLFFNTLFDENASCHLALGQGYPSTVKDGTTMTKQQLADVGVNDSMEHCDFMIGTKDINIVGVTRSGEETQLFVDGEWVI
ncbi:MAG: aminopeptidase [Clostridia bacterium]